MELLNLLSYDAFTINHFNIYEFEYIVPILSIILALLMLPYFVKGLWNDGMCLDQRNPIFDLYNYYNTNILINIGSEYSWENDKYRVLNKETLLKICRQYGHTPSEKMANVKIRNKTTFIWTMILLFIPYIAFNWFFSWIPSILIIILLLYKSIDYVVKYEKPKKESNKISDYKRKLLLNNN